MNAGLRRLLAAVLRIDEEVHCPDCRMAKQIEEGRELGHFVPPPDMTAPSLRHIAWAPISTTN